jgi:uncharacterized protein (TIGR02246 family)
LAVALVVITISSHAGAQNSAGRPTAGAAGPSAGGVEAALRQYVAAFNAHDADKLAALWTPGGVYVDKATGDRTEGRDALAADFRALFAASPQIMLSGAVEHVRAIGDQAAVVEGTTTTVTPDAEPAVTGFTAIFVKQGDAWLLDAVHETPLAAPDAPRQALAPLAWMVGQWRDAAAPGDDAATSVDTSVRWSPSEAFLIRSYSVSRPEEEPLQGTQVIGWDPRAKQIRSWTFNSDGSFGEGVWTRSGDEWLARSSQTLADGRAATATQVFKQLDDNTATVQTIAKEIDGAPEPATEPVTITRLADAAAARGAAASAAGAPVARERTP